MTEYVIEQPKNQDGSKQMVGKTTIITATVGKKTGKEVERAKGERMENDADHMEVWHGLL